MIIFHLIIEAILYICFFCLMIPIVLMLCLLFILDSLLVLIMCIIEKIFIKIPFVDNLKGPLKMFVKATVLFPIEISFRTKERDKEKIKDKIINESHKLFNRQFSKPVIFSSNVDVCDPPEEIIVWEKSEYRIPVK